MKKMMQSLIMATVVCGLALWAPSAGADPVFGQDAPEVQCPGKDGCDKCKKKGGCAKAKKGGCDKCKKAGGCPNAKKKGGCPHAKKGKAETKSTGPAIGQDAPEVQCPKKGKKCDKCDKGGKSKPCDKCKKAGGCDKVKKGGCGGCKNKKKDTLK